MLRPCVIAFFNFNFRLRCEGLHLPLNGCLYDTSKSSRHLLLFNRSDLKTFGYKCMRQSQQLHHTLQASFQYFISETIASRKCSDETALIGWVVVNQHYQPTTNMNPQTLRLPVIMHIQQQRQLSHVHKGDTALMLAIEAEVFHAVILPRAIKTNSNYLRRVKQRQMQLRDNTVFDLLAPQQSRDVNRSDPEC